MTPKNTETAVASPERKLTMTRVEPGSSSSIFTTSSQELLTEMQGAEKLNLPEMIQFKDMPIGSTVSGSVIKLVENFTGKSDMRKARLLQMKHKTGLEFLLPLTGQIKNSLKQYLIDSSELRADAEKAAKGDKKELAAIELLDFYILSPDLVGRTLFVTRRPDSESKKYNKSMFSFDVLLAKR